MIVAAADLGTALVLVGMAVAVVFVAGLEVRYLALAVALRDSVVRRGDSDEAVPSGARD